MRYTGTHRFVYQILILGLPDRLFIIALVSMMTIGVQNYMFGSSAAELTAKLRTLSFKAILRQDSESFLVFSISKYAQYLV